MCSKEKLETIDFDKIENKNDLYNYNLYWRTSCMCKESTFNNEDRCIICNKKNYKL